MAKGSKTVLVVDDDVDLLKMVEILLQGEGYRVVLAEEGQEALSKIDEEMPDMILLDMKMPGMDGWEFAREFHARYDHAIPIVVFTAAEDARKRAEEIGAVSWVGKPFDLDTLLEAVAKYSGAG